MQFFRSTRITGQRRVSGPAWLGLIIVSLLFFWFGHDVFAQASAREGRAGYSLPTGRRAQRSITYAAARRYHASLGWWGCASLFFIPGVLAVGCAGWEFRRWFRQLAETP